MDSHSVKAMLEAGDENAGHSDRMEADRAVDNYFRQLGGDGYRVRPLPKPLSKKEKAWALQERG